MSTKESEAERKKAKLWQQRMIGASKLYEQWSDEFEVDSLEDYYLGHQWRKELTMGKDKPYTINLCYPSVEVKLPSLFFYYPKINITPRPGRADDRQGLVDLRAKLFEDVGDALIHDPRADFLGQVHLSIQEVFYRFGAVEVGYSGDYIDNPEAGKPMLKEKTNEPLMDGDKPIEQPAKVPREGSEFIYFKRIPAKQFRVSVRADNNLERCDWVGYYEWVYLEDLKAHPVYGKKADKLKSSFKTRTDYETSKEETEEERQKLEGMVKIWKIWDLRAKKRLIFPDQGNVILLDEPYDIFPLATLKFHQRMDEFYPLPPMFNWKSPQNELNETREMQRVHRKRFYRRFGVRTGTITVDDLRKLETGGDGTYVEMANPQSDIVPLPDAPLDRAVTMNIPQTKDDFREMSAVSGEARGVSEADTATQANIIESNARLRDGFWRVKVSTFVGQLVKIALKLAVERMALPMWIKTTVDPTGPGYPFEAEQVAQTFRSIQLADAAEDFDFDVAVDVESLSPVGQATKRADWNQVLQLLANPELRAVMATSEVLLRKTLEQYNIRSDRDVAEIQGALQALMPQPQQAAQPQAMPGMPGQLGPGPIPNPAEIQGQLAEQLPPQGMT